MTDKRVLIGMLTPSSNTALEPLCCRMVAGLPEVSMHFSRFRVTEISLRENALGQFEDRPILDAAELLADARMNVIVWNGTSSGWLGFEADHRLCERIEQATGIQATTSVLALNELLERQGAREFGLVTPYLDDVQERIAATYKGNGFKVMAERHLNDRGNFSYSQYDADTVSKMVRDVAKERPGAISTFCTNLHAAHLVNGLENEVGIPIFDTIATAVWKSLHLTGVDTRRVHGWGRLFREHAD